MNYINVAAGVIFCGTKVLLCQRSSCEAHPGKWEFPGGKVEEGETPQQALKRELKEELHIDVTVGAFIAESCFSYGQKHIRLLAYGVREFKGEIQLTVHDRVEWVTVEECFGYDLAEADIPILEELCRVV